MIANVHGHVHEASGLSCVGNVRVVNPGSLRCERTISCFLCASQLFMRCCGCGCRYGGRFGLLTVCKGSSGLWFVEGVQFLTLG